MDVPQGNAPLKNTIRPTLIEKTNEQDGKNTDGIGATPVVILGQDHTLATVPVGNIIQDHVGPDRYEYKADGSLDYDKPVTPIEDKDDHDLNKSINIDNVSPYNLKNVVATIDVPDGMDMSALSVINQDKAFDYTFTFADGTTESGSYTSGSSIPAKANKPIKSIQLKFKDLKAYEKVENFGLNGVLAKKYFDGRDVLPGNVLNTKLNLTFDQANTNRGPADFYGQQKVVAKNPVKPEIHDFRDYLNGQQKSDSTTDLGAKNTGHIYVYNSDMYQDSEKLTYYIVLPTNVVVNSEKGLEDLPADAKVDELQVNGRTVLKISGTYERDTKNRPNHWTLNLDNSNIITSENQHSDLEAYVVLPDNEFLTKWGSKYNPVTNQAELPFVENYNNAYLIDTTPWTVIAATGTYVKSQAKGNKNIGMTSEGQSDDKGSNEMTFGNVVQNSQDKDLHQVTVISRVPNKKDGKSEFNFALKDQDSVKVVYNCGHDIMAEVPDRLNQILRHF